MTVILLFPSLHLFLRFPAMRTYFRLWRTRPVSPPNPTTHNFLIWEKHLACRVLAPKLE